MIEFEDNNFTIEVAWFYSGKDEPVPNVAMEVVDGEIADIRSIRHTDSSLAIIPPLVNAHTHLELSDVSPPIPAGNTFPDWIRKVIGHRASRENPTHAVEVGLREVEAAATLRVADTVPMAQTAHLPATRLYPNRFVEYIGLDDRRVADAIEHVNIWPRSGFHWGAHSGISPHAPYSVRLDLLDTLVATAARTYRAVMMHIAETREELELLEHGTGPMAQMLQDFDVWEPGLFPTRSVCEFIECLSAAPQVLLAHANYFSEREIDLAASLSNVNVVYCPRTHAHFGHEPHPWRRMLERGLNVALGTDSRASNPDLSIWNEAAYLHRTTDAGPVLALDMATRHGSLTLIGQPEHVVVDGSATFSLLECQSPQTEFFAGLFDAFSPVAVCDDGAWVRAGNS